MTFIKGHTTNKGRKWSQETKDKIRKTLIGHKVSKEVREKISKTNQRIGIRPPSRKGIPSSELQKRRASETHRGRKDTKETRLKRIASVRRGDKSHFWKGGITPINHALRMSLEYRLWRKSVFERDNYTCMWCGQKSGKLNADHIKRFSDYPELRFATDNGRTLCRECHKKTNTYGRWGKTT